MQRYNKRAQNERSQTDVDMSEKDKSKDKSIGEFSITFKGRKPEEGDVLIRNKKRHRQKGEVVSGASKMRAAYKTRMARKGAKNKR